MALKKTETIFKAAPGFNHVAAQKTYDLVMKMDQDEAQMFATLVVGEILEDTIEKNLSSVQRQVDRVISKRMEKIRKAAVVAAMRDPEGAREFSKAFSVISKEVRDPFRESDYRRASNGQFTNKVKVQSGVPLIKPRQAKQMGIPEKKLSPAQQKRFQQEYMQLSQFLDAVHSSSAPGTSNDVLLTIKPGRGAPYTVKNNGTTPNSDLWNPEAGERLIEMQARPGNLTAGGAAFGLTSALGGSGERGFRNARTANAVNANFGSFAEDWNRASADTNSTTAPTFQRISAGSQFLGRVAPDGSTASIAAGLGQFVGSHGSDAEKVFGPAARKTAYRYRGMTTEPDSKTVREHRIATERSMGSNYSADERKKEIKRRAEIKQSATFAGAAKAGRRFTEPERQAVMGEALRQATEEMTPRSQRTPDDKRAGRNVLEQYLQRAEVKPSGDLYNLQLESGNTPPSQGFIIDKDGNITTQAAGYGDDHYLPFNLKGLKGLKGGEYVRSRSVGGPTSEDIYAGVMSGATGFAVTSRSGTFHVEFQDDLGKRTPDKARRMTRRYEQLLDAVQSEQVDRMALDPEIRQAIVDGVKEDFPYARPREQSVEVANRIKDFKSSPELSDESDKIALFIAQNRSKAQGGSRDAQTFLAEAENIVAQEKEYKYRLNGAGYEAALKSLQEQFPYYLKVDYKPRQQEDRLATARDKGYVEPGRNRPTEAKAGLYGTVTNKGRKFSASQADYQGLRGTGTVERDSTVVAPGERTPLVGVNAKMEQAAPPATTVADQAAANEKKAVVEDKLVALKPMMAAAIEDNPGFQKEKDLLALDDEAFVRALKEDRASMETLDALITQVHRSIDANGEAPNLSAAINGYKQAAGDIGTKAGYSPLVGRRFPSTPFEFPEYANSGDLANELDRRGVSQGIVTGKALKDMSEDEMANEVEAVRRLIVRTGDNDLSTLALGDFQQIIGGDVDKNSPTLASFRSRGTQGMDDYLENVHRTRYLKSKMGGSEPKDIVVNRGTLSNEVESRRDNLMGSLSTALQNAEDGDADQVEITRLKKVQDDLAQGDITTMADLDQFQAQHSETLAMAMKMMHRNRNS